MRYKVDTETWQLEDDSGRVLSWFDDEGFAQLSEWWLLASWQRRYSYQFEWLGRPIIQLPADVLMMQSLLYRVRPTLVIETGVAHGGSAVFHASILRQLHHDRPADADRPAVVAIDIEIRPENRAALDAHPLRPMITLIEGDSIGDETLDQARSIARPGDSVLVVLDSNHTRAHVAAELAAYAPLVSPGSAVVVMDGIMARLARLPDGDPSWAEDNPSAAVADFLASPAGAEFEIDESWTDHAITHSPGGVLVRRSETS